MGHNGYGNSTSLFDTSCAQKSIINVTKNAVMFITTGQTFVLAKV